MNHSTSSIFTADANPWNLFKSVLSAGDLTGSLNLLGPGAETTESNSSRDRVIYVAQGKVTAIMAAANYMLNTDETLVVPAGKNFALRNPSEAPTKIFTLQLPAVRKPESSLVFPR